MHVLRTCHAPEKLPGSFPFVPIPLYANIDPTASPEAFPSLFHALLLLHQLDFVYLGARILAVKKLLVGKIMAL